MLGQEPGGEGSTERNGLEEIEVSLLVHLRGSPRGEWDHVGFVELRL